MKVCVECGDKIKGEYTELPGKQYMCESYSDEMIDRPVGDELEEPGPMSRKTPLE